MSDTLSKVKVIVSNHLDADAEKVVPEARFVDDLGADSLDLVELIMAFEEEFSIEVSDEEASGLNTVADAVAYIDKALAA